MEFVIEFISNLLYIISFIVIGDLFFGFQRHYKKYEKFVLLVIVLLVTLVWFYFEIWAQFIIHISSILLIIKKCDREFPF